MPDYRLTHLKELEAESIHIIREVAAEFDNPVMLYSIGKDSSVMLHLAMKAFYPGTPPFPLMHVDTTWKFREMIEFRNQIAKNLKMDLLVHTNQEGVDAGLARAHGQGRRARPIRDDATVGSLQRTVEQQTTGGITLPEVILQIQRLFCQGGKTNPRTEGGSRFIEQKKTREVVTFGGIDFEELSHGSLPGSLPGLTGDLCEVLRDSGAGGKQQSGRKKQQKMQLSKKSHLSTQ